ncbi:MAG: response regulator transcription factor [Treponema sp.]|nr:response regulator transcription factor [Treponema sp.]
MEKILIVEDDETVLNFENLELSHEGYTTVTATDGRQAMELFEKENPDLVLLDIMLPELNGIEVLRRIRKTSQLPVILVTAKGETYDKVNGLNTGADDYISKPFAIEELLARISAVLRRSKASAPVKQLTKVQNREVELNLQSMTANVQNQSISLSKLEFLLLKLFMENQNKVLSRSQIIDNVWGKDYFIEENTVDVYVNYLRSKIDQPTKTEYIKTVRGVGYMMVN